LGAFEWACLNRNVEIRKTIEQFAYSLEQRFLFGVLNAKVEW